MNLNIDPNAKQRRKSTLGRRNRTNDPLQPRSAYPVIQINNLPWSRSGKKKQSNLGKASKDYMAKKKLFLISPSSEDFAVNTIQGQTKRSLQNEKEGNSERKPTYSIVQNDSQSADDSILNLTGVQCLKTPSPSADSLTYNSLSIKCNEQYKYSVQDKSVLKSCKAFELPVTNRLKNPGHTCPDQDTSTVRPCFGFHELEPPKSPGPSLFNKLVLAELADLKPPVDPDDYVHVSNSYQGIEAKAKILLDPMNPDDNKRTNRSQAIIKSNINSEVDTVQSLADMIYSVNLDSSNDQLQKNMLTQESKPRAISLSNFLDPKKAIGSSHWPHEYRLLQSNKKQHCISPKSAESNNTVKSEELVLNFSFINENKPENTNLNVTNKHLSIVDEDLDTTDMFLLTEQTILEQDQTFTGQLSTNENCISTLSMNNPCVEPLLEIIDRSEIDEDLDQVLKEIDQGLKDMDQMMKKMNNLKSLIQQIIKKHQCPKSNKEGNKENVPVSTSKKFNNEWINSLKSGNPSLLKTPNLDKFKKPKTSLLDHSTTWTPRSLSYVLHEQVENLFE